MLRVIAASLTLTSLFAFVLPLGQAAGPEGAESPSDEVGRAVREIDRLVAADLARHEVDANPMTDDATFMRRIYLDAIGRIPTIEEAERFLSSQAPGKRRELIDELLGSTGYVSHMFNWWADLLRVKSRPGGPVSGEPYMHWIKEALATDKPYDRMVTELLTATGPAHARGNGATGYYLRDRGMPEDNMANTVRIFLGTRLECAQCHDHPYDKWTQRQFYEMAAFTGGLQYRSQMARSQEGRELRKLAQSVRKEHGNQAYRYFVRQLLRPLMQGIAGSGTGLARLPKDYQYDDGRGGDFVSARSAFGEPLALEVGIPRIPRRLERIKNERRRARIMSRLVPQVGSREAYAQWLTSPENPRFTKVIANRMWKRAMGIGLIEPVDDIKDDTVASNPDLMARLETLMIEVGYDLKSFLRILYNTRTYQRAATAADLREGETYRFAGPVLRRMTAEQMWDSLLTLAEPDVDRTAAELVSPRAEAVYARYEQATSGDPEQLIAQYGRMGRYGDPREARRREARRRRAELRKKAGPTLRKLNKARRRKNEKLEEEALAELKAMGIDLSLIRGARRAGAGMVRASAMRSPARPGHVVRQFGQSDRDQIQASHDGATVPQVLTLLNGFIEEKVLGPAGLRRLASPVMKAIARARSVAARVRAAYLAILSRPPTRAEVSMWSPVLRRGGARDLVWTLANTHEFRFVR